MSGKIRVPTVLVVDDEPLIRWSLSEALSARGCVVLTAASGTEAMEALGLHAAGPVVVVADLRLPDVEGLSLIRTFRRERPDWPLLVMSAFGSPETRAEAESLGVAAFIDKPYDLDTVATLVLSASGSGTSEGS